MTTFDEYVDNIESFLKPLMADNEVRKVSNPYAYFKAYLTNRSQKPINRQLVELTIVCKSNELKFDLDYHGQKAHGSYDFGTGNRVFKHNQINDLSENRIEELFDLIVKFTCDDKNLKLPEGFNLFSHS